MATDQEHRRFAMLKLHTPQLAFKFRKLEALAKLPWLALKRDQLNGGAYYGCVACHAYARERPEKVFKNKYVNFTITVERLLLDSAKPHVLLRHAKTQLRLQAVASVLGVSLGAHVNTTLTLNIPCPPDALARLGLARTRGLLACPVGIRSGRSFRHCMLGGPS